MPNIVECPICDAKYDATGIKNGIKLRCARCKKVVGTIMSGTLLPILESVQKKQSPTQVLRKSKDQQNPTNKVLQDQIGVPSQSRPEIRQSVPRVMREQPKSEAAELTPSIELNQMELEKAKLDLSVVQETSEQEMQEPTSHIVKKYPEPILPSYSEQVYPKQQVKIEPEKSLFKKRIVDKPKTETKVEPSVPTAVEENLLLVQKLKEKPNFILIVAGLMGAAAIVMLIYILLAINKTSTISGINNRILDKNSVSETSSGNS